ncbi:MAG TPA: hypothetical protein VK457_23925, partial [Chloroflexota bacterium]|nr:hypothetical protein [Chloroflexota bacterium]
AQQFSQSYVAQHIFPLAATHALNDTFTVAMIGCGIATVLAIFLGRDPAVEASKKAAERGESISPQPAMVGE